MSFKRPRNPGRNVTTFTEQEVAGTVREFEALLDRKASEADVHQFLATHMYFWNGLLRATSLCPLYSKVRLGSEYEIDFAFFDAGSSGAEWFLVELERPAARLFNSRGDPSADLTHAIAQVRAWQRWIERNRSAAQEIMPEIDRPMGIVFIGRRRELDSVAARERLRALNIEQRNYVEVRTLDRFISQAWSICRWGSMSVPPVALGDRQLRAGLPKVALDWIHSPFAQQRIFVEDRDGRDHFDEDFKMTGPPGGETTIARVIRRRKPSEDT